MVLQIAKEQSIFHLRIREFAQILTDYATKR